MGAHAAFLLLLLQTPDYLTQGIAALKANEIEPAVQLLTKAVAAEPKEYAAHFHLALAYSLENRDSQAIPEYQKTLELKPGLYQAQLNLGILLLRQKQFADAEKLIADAALQKPREFRPQLYLGDALMGLGDASGAVAHYTTALEIDPKSAAAELGLGRAQLAGGELPDAATHIRKAVALDASYRDALLELAAAYEKVQQPADAIAIYRDFPQNSAAQERLGELLIETKDFASAIPRLEQAVAASPTTANRLALATAYKMNKDVAKELVQLDKAVATEPGSYDIHMAYGRELRDQRQFVPASNQFYTAAKLKPASKEAWNELASVLIIHEDYAAGLAALDKVKSLGEETAGNYYLRAITLDKIRQLPEALASYQQFLAVSQGKNPNEEFKARQRSRIIQKELSKR